MPLWNLCAPDIVFFMHNNHVVHCTHHPVAVLHGFQGNMLSRGKAIRNFAKVRYYRRRLLENTDLWRTDGQTDRHMAMANTALAQRRAGKNDWFIYYFYFVGFSGAKNSGWPDQSGDIGGAAASSHDDVWRQRGSAPVGHVDTRWRPCLGGSAASTAEGRRRAAVGGSARRRRWSLRLHGGERRRSRPQTVPTPRSR